LIYYVENDIIIIISFVHGNRGIKGLIKIRRAMMEKKRLQGLKESRAR